MATSAGPSRGGGRGRGGGGGAGGGRGGFGRGGGGGGGGARTNALPMGMFTWSDFLEVDKATPNKHAYPPIKEEPLLQRATEREARMMANQQRFVQAQRETPWWPVIGNELLVRRAATGSSSSTTATTTTTMNEKEVKSVSAKRGSAILPRYSDKFRKSNGASALAMDGTTGCDKTVLDTLQREAFPVGLWRAYVEGDLRRQERRQETLAANRKRRGDWERIMQGVELNGGADAASDGLPSEEEEDAHQDEYEDDVEDDYADNYFDNGEDDDIGDDGGGGEGGEDVYD